MKFRLRPLVAAALAVTVVATAAAGCAPQRRGAPNGAGGLGEGTAGLHAPGTQMDLGLQISALVARLDNLEALGAPGAPGAPDAGGLPMDAPGGAPDAAGGAPDAAPGGAPGAAGGAPGAAPGGAPGAAAERNVGVTTLVVGNLAYIGIDMNTVRGAGAGPGDVPPGGALRSPGVTGVTPGGGTTGGNPAGGVTPGQPPGGDTAGGEPGPGMTAGPGPAAGGRDNATGPQATIGSQVRSAFPQIADVYVTTDPALVHRMARVGADIQSGVSMAGRLDEVFAIARTMTMTGRGAAGGEGGEAGPDGTIGPAAPER